MLTLPRSLVRQIRILLSRALDLPARIYTSCPVHISAGPHGLTIRTQVGGYAAEYRQTTPQPPVELVTNLGLLHAVEGKKPDPVTFIHTDTGTVTARWHEGPIPRVLSDDPPPVDAGAKFPEAPTQWTQNPPGLWSALASAQGTTDPSAARYALGCIQLRGKSGVVAATDGSQLFRESGFEFGFEGEVLIRGLKLFASRELPLDHPVEVGQLEKCIVLRSGPWTFWLPTQEGRFPRVDDVVPSPAATRTTLCLPPAQQHFLKEHLPRLKCEGLNEHVTLDLNGQIAIRTRENDAAPPMQLTLTRASYLGDPMRLVSARRYLQRALELGFSEVSLISPEAVIVCRDGRRDYVWMAIDPKLAVPTTPDTVEIFAPDAIELRGHRSFSRRNALPPSPISPSTDIMPSNATNTVPSRSTKPKAEPSVSKASLIEQCQSVRSKLRELLADTNDLIRAAKRQKQSERLVRSTLAGLKQLQTVA